MTGEKTREELAKRVQQLEEELAQQERFHGITDALFKISNAVNLTSELGDLYESIHSALSTIMDTSNFYIARYNKSKDTATFPYCKDLVDECYPTVVGISKTESLTAEVIRKERSLLIYKDEVLKQREKTRKEVPACTPSEIWLGVPLRTQDGIIGVMTVQSYTDANRYDRTDLEVMASVADQVALAIERKQAEETLRESKEKYQTILANIEDSYFEVTREGDITFFNEAFTKITGYSPDELMGMKNDIYLDHENKEKVFNKFNQVWKSELPTKLFEYELIRKNGEKRTVQTSASLVTDKNGKKVGFRGIIRDVSYNKLMEKALRNSEEKLVRSKKMESLGLLAGGVAHDLNNVLSGIVSYPELLLMDLPEDSKLKKPIETIQETGHRAAAIVQDLLTVARGVAIVKEILNLNEIIEKYLLSPEFKKLEQFHPTVTVRTTLDPDLLNIHGSDAHLRKIVMNLVSNASEAIEGGGNVVILTINRYVDRPLKGYDDVNVGEYVVLSVADDGPGISPDDLERVFEPFYTKKIMGRSGTGLGLAVVWNTVQDHQGYIDVTSNSAGTAFELYFPITRDEIPGKDLTTPIENFKGDGEEILVVDDMESQRDISCKMLEVLGYKTKAVSSGEEAVEYLRKHAVDLLLLDMIMAPGINGRETYERIIKMHPGQKAVIISGFAETDEVRKAQELGAGQYIKKPATLEILGVAVKKELDKS
jgi:PAS domain S-box-containing protein